MSKLTELEQEFLENYCMTSEIDNNYYVSASNWDKYTDTMKGMLKKGYTFSASHASKDGGSQFQYWFEKR